MSLTHSLKWSFLAELVSKAITPAVFIVLAGFLTPEDFGVMTAALMVIAFSQIFWEAGMGKALIQRQTEVEVAANVAFWINIGLGVVIGAVLFVAAQPISSIFFHDERVAVVIQVMTLQVFLGAVSSVHIALLQKDMSFKKLFWVRFSTVGLPGLASIPLALNGMGYWALVAGVLLGQVVQVCMLWRISHWRPKWSFHVPIAKEMSRFGAWVGTSGLLVWFYLWADSLIVGMYLGSHALGLYRFGNLLVTSVIGLVVSPVIPVAYSYFSKSQSDSKKLNENIVRGEKTITMALFVIAALMIISSSLIESLFGGKWEGLSLVVSLVVIAQVMAYTVSLKQEAYRAIGRPDIEFKIMFISMLIRLPFYFVFIKYGLDAFMMGRIMSVVLGIINHLLFAKVILHLMFLDYIKTVSVSTLSAISSGLVGMYVIQLTSEYGLLSSTLLAVMACGLLYLILIVVFEREFLKRIYFDFKRK